MVQDPLCHLLAPPLYCQGLQLPEIKDANLLEQLQHDSPNQAYQDD